MPRRQDGPLRCHSFQAGDGPYKENQRLVGTVMGSYVDIRSCGKRSRGSNVSQFHFVLGY